MLLSVVLIAATLIAGALQIQELKVKPLKFRPWAILSCLFVAAVVSFILERKGKKAEEYSQNYGKLTSDKVDKDIVWDTGIGSVTFANGVMDWENYGPTKGIGVVAWSEKNKLYVSATVRDQDGNIIAQIERNFWKTNPNLTFDKNFDSKTFEVKNSKGEIVMQIIMNQNKVSIEGLFYNNKGEGLLIQRVIFPDGKRYFTEILKLPGNTNYESHSHLVPIFKYPSEAFPGVRVDK